MYRSYDQGRGLWVRGMSNRGTTTMRQTGSVISSRGLASAIVVGDLLEELGGPDYRRAVDAELDVLRGRLDHQFRPDQASLDYLANYFRR